MEARPERFRKSVEKYFGGRPGRGARYPEDLQQEAVFLARAGVLEGKSLESIARELGVGAMTLAGWLEKIGVSEPLRPVEIQREPDKEKSGKAFALAVVTPSGWRIEGLCLEDVPELLRALG
jgi:hypothetical protein